VLARPTLHFFGRYWQGWLAAEACLGPAPVLEMRDYFNVLTRRSQVQSVVSWEQESTHSTRVLGVGFKRFFSDDSGVTWMLELVRVHVLSVGVADE
jgi:hypothetical protein